VPALKCIQLDGFSCSRQKRLHNFYGYLSDSCVLHRKNSLITPEELNKLAPHRNFYGFDALDRKDLGV
jgi:hypothetical protein